MKNIKTVKIIISNEVILSKINKTFALKQLSRLSLKVGENIEKVNHYQYSEQKRMFACVGVEVVDITNENY